QQLRHHIQRIRKLNHPNLLRIHEEGWDGQHYYFTMQYLEGLSLRKIMNLRREKKQLFTSNEILPIFSQLCDVLSYLHTSMFHGLLKPENIIVLPELIKLTDVGLATIFSPEVLLQRHPTPKSAYITPEQRQFCGDASSDIYAMGVLLAEMLTGIVSEPLFQSILTYQNQCHPLIDQVFQKATQEQDDKRYQHISEMFADLEHIQKYGELAEHKPPATLVSAQPAKPPQELTLDLEEELDFERAFSESFDELASSQEKTVAGPPPQKPETPPPPQKTKPPPPPQVQHIPPQVQQNVLTNASPLPPSASYILPSHNPSTAGPHIPPLLHRTPSPTTPHPQPTTSSFTPASMEPQTSSFIPSTQQPKPTPQVSSPIGTLFFLAGIFLFLITGCIALYFKFFYLPQIQNPQNSSKSPLLIIDAQSDAQDSTHPKLEPTPEQSLPEPIPEQTTPELVPEPTPKLHCPKEMSLIPEGNFLMGSAADDPMRNLSDKKRSTTPTPSYCIDRYEFPGKARAPKNIVSWFRAKALCAKQGKRLCSEIEWERACKGIRNLRYPYGNPFDPNACNTRNAKSKNRKIRPSGSTPKCKSSFNVFDMSGNVAEWTASSQKRRKVVRGGASNRPDWDVRCDSRALRTPRTRKRHIGFRCCQNPLSKPPE
ncbi:MAG: SUMF1/EgtB/PvdO family nonheme iron enzyme, partial [Myxococcota bacterium]